MELAQPSKEDAKLDGSAPPCNELQTKFVELEYKYLIQSSLHSDDLRNRIIQLYLIIAGAAGTVILGLAELSTKPQQSTQASPVIPIQVFSVVACFIGVIGVVMLPIFVRLRCVVLECLLGTILLKFYTIRKVKQGGDESFVSSLLWDAHTLPTDERYLTASFLLIFVVILLNSAMFAIAILLLLSEQFSTLAASLWSLTVLIGTLTLQVILYRWLLWREISRITNSKRLKEKWDQLVVDVDKDAKLQAPVLWRPLFGALVVGGIPTGVIAYAAWQLTPLTAILNF